MPKSKKSKQADYDDDASEPYSDELNVSSPELLEMDDDGEVVMNSDWSKAQRKSKQKSKTEADDVSGEGSDVEGHVADDQDNALHEAEDEDISDSEEWESEAEETVNFDEEAERKLSSISFGTLAKAQSLAPAQTKKRKKGANDDEADEKLAALRLRLKELQNGQQWKQQREDLDDAQSQSDSDASGPEEDDTKATKTGRSSKHAPMVLSSKRQVTRKRHAVDVPKANVRDPRFDPTAELDRDKIRKNYSFLDGYVDSEIKDLKATLKSQKAPQVGSKKKKVKGAQKLSEEQVDALKRELVQKESKRNAQAARDRHADVLKEHKKKERELVRSGKKAYFLKNSDVKQKILTKQFEGMSEGKREKIMEKKRKKIASKERRFMPEARRTA